MSGLVRGKEQGSAQCMEGFAVFFMVCLGLSYLLQPFLGLSLVMVRQPLDFTNKQGVFLLTPKEHQAGGTNAASLKGFRRLLYPARLQRLKLSSMQIHVP